MTSNEGEWLAERFEENRPHLRAMAYRILGSLSDAEDAVQQGWLRLNRSDVSGIDNFPAWLTTVVARVCLDMLRSRQSRREESLDVDAIGKPTSTVNAEDEALLADSVGLALLVILDTLTPPERLAFVLHDMFGMSFEEIAPIIDRSPAAARQLASRARRRVQGAPKRSDANVIQQREVVDAFLAAARGGDLNALLAVLDTDVVLRSDRAALPPGAPTEIRGAAAVASRATRGGARAAQPALVNGEVGVIVAPRGRLLMVLRFTIVDRKIVEIDAVADSERLRQLDLAILSR